MPTCSWAEKRHSPASLFSATGRPGWAAQEPWAPVRNAGPAPGPSGAVCSWPTLPGSLCTLKADKAVLVPLNRTHVSSPPPSSHCTTHHKSSWTYFQRSFSCTLGHWKPTEEGQGAANLCVPKSFIKVYEVMHTALTQSNAPTNCNWWFPFYAP